MLADKCDCYIMLHLRGRCLFSRELESSIGYAVRMVLIGITLCGSRICCTGRMIRIGGCR